MKTRLFMGILLACAVGCGGGDPDSEPPTATTDDSSSGDEVASEPAPEVPVAQAEEPAEPEDDGMACLPVARCHSFANQDCVLVDDAGEIAEGPHAGGVEEACPGQRGVAESVAECFQYVETSDSCRRRPELRHPEWPCGRTDTARCGIVM